MTGISIPQDAMNQIVQKAILDSITPEQREEILAQAVALLTTSKKSDSYGRPTTSPLEDAMSLAVESETRTVVREMLDADVAVKERIGALVGPVLAEIVSTEYDLAEKVGEAIGSAIAAWLRDRRY